MDIEHAPSERNPALLEEASTADLVREALNGAKELVQLEVALAKEEVKEELVQVKHAAIAGGIAAGAAMVSLSVLAVALVLALGGTALVALAVAGVFLLIAAAAGYAAYAMLPSAALGKTRSRLQNDMNQLKEHIA